MEGEAEETWEGRDCGKRKKGKLWSGHKINNNNDNKTYYITYD